MQRLHPLPYPPLLYATDLSGQNSGANSSVVIFVAISEAVRNVMLPRPPALISSRKTFEVLKGIVL